MFGERIRLARARMGYSLERLAQEIGVTRQAISKYELGQSAPSSGVLLRLARALGVKPEFFLRVRSVELGRVAFRKRISRLGKKEEQAIRASVQEWLERYIQMEEILGEQARVSFRLPPAARRKAASLADVEDVADNLRVAWNLGKDPIESVTRLLEDKGVKVHVVEAPGGFDGLTTEVAGSPVIVTRSGVPGDRQRFSLAHELGHLALTLSPGLEENAFANRFAGALLVPRSAAEFELGGARRRLDPRELLLLKLKYGLSMQGWVMRARDLSLLSEAAASGALTRFRSRGWHRREPDPQFPQEEPGRLQLLVMHALAEGLITESKAAELLGKSLWSFRTQIAGAQWSSRGCESSPTRAS